MYTEINACRICGGENLASIMALGQLALTGVFPKKETDIVATGPVDLVKCVSPDGCGLVQLKQSYSLDAMYGMNYGYRSGLNASMVRHLHSKVRKILSMGVLEAGDVVLDIGSNDSTTLQAYPTGGFELFGVDPTGVKFESYYPPEITLVPEFFSERVVGRLLGGRKAKVITSFSMFYDLEDPVAFAREVAATLHESGIWVLEQSYLPMMLKTNSFDTICHEHLEFYSLRQISWICREAGLKLLDVEFNEVNGGSFSISVAKLSSPLVPNHDAIAGILEAEEKLGLGGLAPFESFRTRVHEAGRRLTKFLVEAKASGKSVYALGASTKGNVLLQYFGLDRSLISGIGEVNPDKFGSFTPGSLIPILPEEEVLRGNPDYLLVLPWHFKDFFLNNERFRQKTLVFPLPELMICRPR
jgi:NDP-4-keto-2,6-dideoxyhexose 3-C-methyltransferase